MVTEGTHMVFVGAGFYLGYSEILALGVVVGLVCITVIAKALIKR